MKNEKRLRAGGSGPGGRLAAGRKGVAAAVATLVVASGIPASLLLAPAAQGAPVGAGFELDRGDLEFILKQIKISERHVATRTAEAPCSTLLGTGENQIPDNGPNGEVLPFMVLSRATIDEDHNAVNLTTPFVDQNQTYTSSPVPPGVPA